MRISAALPDEATMAIAIAALARMPVFISSPLPLFERLFLRRMRQPSIIRQTMSSGGDQFGRTGMEFCQRRRIVGGAAREESIRNRAGAGRHRPDRAA